VYRQCDPVTVVRDLSIGPGGRNQFFSLPSSATLVSSKDFPLVVKWVHDVPVPVSRELSNLSALTDKKFAVPMLKKDTVIGDYKIRTLLATGDFSQVYWATRSNGSGRFVVKVVWGLFFEQQTMSFLFVLCRKTVRVRNY
jgi:hypothetical protein